MCPVKLYDKLANAAYTSKAVVEQYNTFGGVGNKLTDQAINRPKIDLIVLHGAEPLNPKP